jgi:signal transduction histidine kinase
LETAWQSKGGERISISLSVSPLIGPTGAIVGASLIGRDITEQKRLEREIIDISAREQERIGQDLHDGIGQKLTGAAFRARALEHKLALRSCAESHEAAAVVEILNDAVSHTQHMARSLFPIDLDRLGIGPALQHLASTFELQYSIPCVALISEGPWGCDSEAQRELYLIAHEAAHNAFKHANARQVIISLETNAGGLTLRIHDDGEGFSAIESPRSGMGLWIMRYRTRQIGANLSIQSDPSSGTTVTCTLPAPCAV